VICINSDDPPMFGTDLGNEYRSIASTFGLGIGDLAELVANGVRSAFLPDTAKTPLLAEIATITKAAQAAETGAG
jgi:aminodeoxyfutalosine deaminase